MISLVLDSVLTTPSYLRLMLTITQTPVPTKTSCGYPRAVKTAICTHDLNSVCLAIRV